MAVSILCFGSREVTAGALRRAVTAVEILRWRQPPFFHGADIASSSSQSLYRKRSKAVIQRSPRARESHWQSTSHPDRIRTSIIFLPCLRPLMRLKSPVPLCVTEPTAGISPDTCYSSTSKLHERREQFPVSTWLLLGWLGNTGADKATPGIPAANWTRERELETLQLWVHVAHRTHPVNIRRYTRTPVRLYTRVLRVIRMCL